MAIDIAIDPEPSDSTQTATFRGSVGNDRPFVIGTGTMYQSQRGLVHEGGALLYDPAAYPQYGQWAQLIDCTAYCESKRSLTCLNTYDRARFTFGCLQFAAHVADGDFVRWLHLLLQQDHASDYLPDLTLVDGRVCRLHDGATEPLENAQSTAGLMDYLNADPAKVDHAETLAAARLTYWIMTQQAARDTHIEVGDTIFRATIAARANQLGLDGQPDFIVAAIMDILHQGRGTISDIKAALAATSDEVQLDRLLGIGAILYPSRCADLRSVIAQKRRSGDLGTHAYDSAAKDFRAAPHALALKFNVARLLPPSFAPATSPAASLADTIMRLERRAACEMFEGIRLADDNISGNVLLVTGDAEFHSFDPSDILDEETLSGQASRLWVRRGARAWRSTAIQIGAVPHMRATIVGMEDEPPPPMAPAPGAPDEATPSHRRALLDLAQPSSTITGAAAAYRGSCVGGDRYANNCAHFLSDAFIRAGFTELAAGGSASGFVHARCDTSAKRVIRARDMWAWFQSKATETATTLQKNTGLWAVFQLDEAQYWGGHVVIIDTDTWTWHGTASYPQWGQHAYKW